MVSAIDSVSGYAAPPVASAGGGVAFQQKTNAPVSPNSENKGSAAIAIRYLTPYLAIQPGAGTVVYETRDPSTGKVLSQLPLAKSAVQQYKNADQQSGSPLTDQTVNLPEPVKAPAAPVVAAAPVAPAEPQPVSAAPVPASQVSTS